MLTTEELKQVHIAAERALIDWVNTAEKSGLLMSHIGFMLQFRLWDINRMAAEFIPEISGEPKK